MGIWLENSVMIMYFLILATCSVVRSSVGSNPMRLHSL